MKANLGSTDRLLRLVAGVLLLGLALFGGLPAVAQPGLTYGSVVVGLILVATAAIRFCPLYAVLGLRTCRR